MQSIYRQFGITDKVLAYAEPVLARLEERFKKIDETAEYNQLRIIKAMQDAHIGEPVPDRPGVDGDQDFVLLFFFGPGRRSLRRF